MSIGAILSGEMTFVSSVELPLFDKFNSKIVFSILFIRPFKSFRFAECSLRELLLLIFISFEPLFKAFLYQSLQSDLGNLDA